MRKNVLFPALKKLALGEKTVRDEFDLHVDEVFFDDLFGAIDLEEEEAQLRWNRRLHGLAWNELQRAIDRCSVPSIRWYRNVSDAESVFQGCLTRQFPTLAASLRRSASTAGEAS